MERKPLYLGKRVKEYLGLVDYILLDPSGGRGESFHPEAMDWFLEDLQKEVGNKIGLGVAGGLSAETLKQQIGPLVKKYPDLSIDAEGRLRDENDNLDLAKATLYIRKARKIFKC